MHDVFKKGRALPAPMGMMMKSESGSTVGERQEQQQQGSRPDLEQRYGAIGIPAVSAAASMTRTKRPERVSHIADVQQFED